MKLIFLDIDGTIINYEAKTPISAKVAINKAKENGHLVYLCTGCSKAEVKLRDLPLVDGMILANGAYIEVNDKVIYHNKLEKEEIERILEFIDNRDLAFYAECNDGMFCNKKMKEIGIDVMIKYSLNKGKDKDEAYLLAKSFIDSFTLLDNKEIINKDINKISYVLSDYSDYLKAKDIFKDYSNNTWGGKDHSALFGDISKITSKGDSINRLLDYLKIDRSNTIGFGDASIDIAMMESCAYSVAMGNSSEDVKEYADYVTDDVDNDGLYKAFRYLSLI